MTHKQVAGFILKLLRPFRPTLGLMTFVSVCMALDLSLRPYVMKVILNRLPDIPASQVVEGLAGPALLYFGLTILHTTLFRFHEYFVDVRMVPLLRLKISDASFETLLKQGSHFYHNQFAGSLANKVGDLVNNIPDLVKTVLEQFLRVFLIVLTAIAFLWTVNVTFAILMSLWAGGCILYFWISSKRLLHRVEHWSELCSVRLGHLVDGITNHLSICLFARKSEELSSFHHTATKTIQAEQRLQKGYCWVWGGYGYSYALLQGLSLYYLIKGRQAGTVTIGDFALVITINDYVSHYLWELTKHFTSFSKLWGRTTQALRTIMVKPEIQDALNATSLVVKRGEITFDHVQFSYPGVAPLFEKKSITIASGQKVGLVGYSGSGKSTFVNLILRLYELNSGTICIDGQDIREVTQESLHASIGMIPQDPSLFHRSLMENIRYGYTGATDAEVIEAAKRAHADGFIAELPQKYDSLVGERGVKLSGGQRQRIAIARAILKNAPILMLDEATSQLDSITEQYIQNALWELMQDKTTIVVAHRLSTLLCMDRILVFDKGKIVEDGTHTSLLAKGGMYKTLWDAQVGGFLPERRISC